jgi:hypothetical protein
VPFAEGTQRAQVGEMGAEVTGFGKKIRDGASQEKSDGMGLARSEKGNGEREPQMH